MTNDEGSARVSETTRLGLEAWLGNLGFLRCLLLGRLFQREWTPEWERMAANECLWQTGGRSPVDGGQQTAHRSQLTAHR